MRTAAASAKAVTEDRLAAKLGKVTARLAADAPNTERPGADLIAYNLSRSATQQAGPGHASTPTPNGGYATCALCPPTR